MVIDWCPALLDFNIVTRWSGLKAQRVSLSMKLDVCATPLFRLITFLFPCIVLLDIVDKLRPFSKEKWEEVSAIYNSSIAGNDNFVTRDVEALKRRFMVLAYQKKQGNNDEWKEYMDRATALHQSILEESSASPIPFGLLRHDADGMLLLTENEQEMVNNAASMAISSFEGEDFIGHSPASSTFPTPVRTGKRGRPPGSTTGAAAKRMAQQAEQLAILTRVLKDTQKTLKELKAQMDVMSERQAHQECTLAQLQQQWQQAASIVSHVDDAAIRKDAESLI